MKGSLLRVPNDGLLVDWGSLSAGKDHSGQGEDGQTRRGLEEEAYSEERVGP